MNYSDDVENLNSVFVISFTSKVLTVAPIMDTNNKKLITIKRSPSLL